MKEDDKYVIYNGVKMVEWWPAKIEEAQKITTIILKGKEYTRIIYGSESDDWGADDHACGDCGVLKGQYHAESCDIEECPCCHGQIFSCDCYEED